MNTREHELSYIIRPVELKDARDINSLRRRPSVAENLMALPSETIVQNEEFITKHLSSLHDHLFCAEYTRNGQSRVIGLAGLHLSRIVRQRHSASLGIMVHDDFHRQGIGAKLMATLIDLADNWLMLKRVDLTVYPDIIQRQSFMKNSTSWLRAP